MTGAESMVGRGRRLRASALAGTAAVVLGLALGSFSCSSGDPIEAATGTLTLELEVSPVYSGPYLFATMNLLQVKLRPVNSTADQYLLQPLAGLSTTRTVNLRQGGVVALGSIPLRAGAYRLESVEVFGFKLNVVNTRPIRTAACAGSELVEASSPETTGDRTVLQFPNAPLIQVPSGGTAKLSLAVDAPGIVQMLVGLPWVCGNPPFVQDVFPAPTTAQVQPYVTVR